VGRRLATADDDPFAIPRLQVRPGTSPSALQRLLDRGEPGPVPALKTWVQPAWRLVRAASLRGLGLELT
jgi:hypothetical protein